MARYAIVDGHDRVIGSKPSREFKPGEHYRIAILCIFNSRGETLIAQRALSKATDPGRWSPSVGGTVEEGESYESNIYKEAEEELGISGVIFEQGPKFETPDIGNGVGYFCQSYYVFLDWPLEKFRLQVEEVSAVHWINTTELQNDARVHPEQYTVNFADSFDAVLSYVHKS